MIYSYLGIIYFELIWIIYGVINTKQRLAFRTIIWKRDMFSKNQVFAS